MTYKMPTIFSSRSRNVADNSVLKHAGTQVFQNKNDFQRSAIMANASTAVTPHTERYGVTPYLSRGDDLTKSLDDMNFKLQPKGRYTSAISPHFFKQVKDAEEYVADLNMRPETIRSGGLTTKSFIGKDIQYDVDFFIRASNSFDTMYK